MDQELVGLNTDVNILVERNGQTYIKEVYCLTRVEGLIENVYGTYGSSLF